MNVDIHTAYKCNKLIEQHAPKNSHTHVIPINEISNTINKLI